MLNVIRQIKMKMKNLNLLDLSYCIVLVILFFNTNQVNAQIINGGFEQWTSSGPANWMTDDYPDQGMIPVTKSTDAYSGSYALMGQALKINDTLAMGIPR